MKKIIFALTALCAIFGCTKFEHDAEFQKVETGAPVIKAESVADTITATITAADKNTAYYSYAILEGAADPTIDPETLLSDGYADYTLASSCIDVKKSETVTVKVAELDPGETYTVYAVAASTNGVLSKVSTKEIIIKDGQAPVPSGDAEYQLNEESFMAAIPFSRPIKLGEKASVNVKGWGIYDGYNGVEDGDYTFIAKPRTSFSIPTDSLAVSGNYLLVTLPAKSYVPGMIYSFTFDAGTVISQPVSEGAEANVPCEAYTDEYVYYGYGLVAGAGFQTETSTFSFTASKDNPTYVIYKKFGEYEFAFNSPLPIDDTEDKFASAVYTTDNSLRKYDLSKSEAKQLSETSYAFLLPVEPEEGENVGFSIPAESFYDIYGNTNEAFEIEAVPSGDYTFTVNAEGKKVNFASGNLYWDGSNFNFEESQTAYATQWDSTHVSHFYWAKSAAVAYATDYKCDIEDFTALTEDDFFANKIFKGWGVLNQEEWVYLLKNNKIQKGALVNGVMCSLIAPDGFTGELAASYDGEAWTAAEEEGIICIPMAGYRVGSTIETKYKYGKYWTSTYAGEKMGPGSECFWAVHQYYNVITTPARTIDISAFTANDNQNSKWGKDGGNTIRLVKEVK